MPTFEIKVAGRRQPDLDEEADQGRDRRSDQARQAASELRRFTDRREQRQQPRPRHAGDPLRAVGARRHRSEAAAEGRRLREHERAVFAAGGARASRPRRSHDRRRAQVHPARGVERARQGLRARRDRRVHRRRSHERLRRSEAAVVPQPRRRQSGSAARRSRSRDHADREHARRRADGLRRKDLADRLQGRRAESLAGELLRVDRVRLLGVSPSRRHARRIDRRDHAVALSRSVGADDPDDGPGRLQAHRTRSRAARADRRGDDPIAEGRRRRADQRSGLHGTRCRASSPREPRAAGRSQRRRDLSLRSGRGEAAGWRMEGHRRGPDDEHSRGAVSGRHHRQVRRTRGDRQGRHGREDARRAQAARRRVPQRYRRCCPVLRALYRPGGWRVAPGVWNS